MSDALHRTNEWPVLLRFVLETGWLAGTEKGHCKPGRATTLSREFWRGGEPSQPDAFARPTTFLIPRRRPLSLFNTAIYQCDGDSPLAHPLRLFFMLTSPRPQVYTHEESHSQTDNSPLSSGVCLIHRSGSKLKIWPL